MDAQLIQKKDKITQSMNFYKGPVSPLWRFPNELLSQIFHHCLPDTVCRRWREVATSTPSLRCRLHMEVDDTDWQRASSYYDSWLKWSRGLPPSLVVKCYKHNHSTTLRRLLHPYMNQISSLSIFFFSDADKPELLLTNLPVLEELTMFFNARATLASVSQLPFSKYRRNYLGSMWDRLTDFEIGAIYEPHSAIKLLQLCPIDNLSSFTIHESLYYRLHAIEPFTHPKIQSLRINLTSPAPELYDGPLCELLGALLLPNLRFLEVRSYHPCGARRLHKVLKVLLESKCPLKSPMFGSQVEMTDEQQAEYIALIPSLEMGIAEEEYFTASVETMLLLHEA
ncbi:hypothetical protein F4604DRAFT_1825737 [Suillus subluteus]|nr:hypothetical protein F4604DRAFT_1825737 [Suillus subluteus]